MSLDMREVDGVIRSLPDSQIKRLLTDLRASVAELERSAGLDAVTIEELRAERDALSAQLRAAREQEPVAHMFPDDLKRFAESETFAQAYSVPVGAPDRGTTAPLYAAPVPPSQEVRDAEVFAPDWANYRQGVEDGKREAESVAIGVSRDAGRWRAVVANLAWSAWTADRSVLIGLSVPKDAGPYNGDKVRDFTETADHFAAILAAKEKK